MTTGSPPDDLARLRAEDDLLHQRLAATEALERRYRDMVENSVQGMFQTTPEGKYLYVNPTLARLYGYASPEDLIANTDAAMVYVDQV